MALTDRANHHPGWHNHRSGTNERAASLETLELERTPGQRFTETRYEGGKLHTIAYVSIT